MKKRKIRHALLNYNDNGNLSTMSVEPGVDGRGGMPVYGVGENIFRNTFLSQLNSLCDSEKRFDKCPIKRKVLANAGIISRF